MTTNSEQKTQQDEWSQCESGEIGSLVGSMQANRRHRQLRTISTIGSAMVVLLVAALLFMKPQQNTSGGIACNDVVIHTQGYLANKITASLRDQIDIHLAGCEKCRNHVEGIKAQTLADSAPIRVFDVSEAPFSRDLSDPDLFSTHDVPLVSYRD